jgi:8-oxo-dGTP diphosphatase
MEAQGDGPAEVAPAGGLRGPYVGVASIVCRNGQVLLGERCGSHGADTWALSGGKLQVGESIEACALRELEEETGLRGGHPRLLAVTNDVMTDEGLHFVTIFVEVTGVVGEPEIREPHRCRGWRWCTPKYMPEPLFGPLRGLVERHPEVLHQCCNDSLLDWAAHSRLSPPNLLVRPAA